MTSNKNTRILHNINCDELVLDTNNDAKNLHFNIRTIGGVGQNDIHFKTCNVKVNDGDFHTDVIKDLDGNEFVNLSGANHVIKDVSGDPIMTIGDSSIDFHSATVNNLTLGSLSLDTSDIQSINYVGENLEHELDTIATNITAKLGKDGQTTNKILTTSSGGVIQFVNNSSLLTQITTNQTDIGTNTSSISTNTTDITDISNSVATNTTNIASKLAKDGQTAYKILTTSPAGIIQFSYDINLLDQITTNQTDIGTNSSSISSITTDITDISNSVATNTTDITDISNSVATNTTNIASNTANVATALSNISTLDNTTLKLDETQTISGYNFYDTSSELSVSSNRFHIYNNANDTRAYFTHSYAGNVTLTLPSSTGTLSLKSPVDTNTTNIATNTSNIATKLPLAGGTLSGKLTIDDTTTPVTDELLLDLKSEATATGKSYTSIKLQKAANYGGLIKGYLLQGVGGGLEFFTLQNGAETSIMELDNTYGITFNGDITSNNKITINNSSTEQLLIQNSTANHTQVNIIGGGTGSLYDANIFMGQSSSYGGGIFYDASDDYLKLYRRNNGTDSNVLLIPFDSDDVVIGDIKIGQTNEINSSTGLYINDDSSSYTTYINRNGGAINLSTSGTPRVGIGAAANFPLQITGGVNPSGSYTRISPEHKDSVSGSPNFYVVASRTTTNPTSTGGADTDGKIGIECSDCSVKAHYYFFNSDKRIKKEITDLSDDESLSIIRDISCVKYKYIDSIGRGDGWTYGFIANQVAEVFPNAVRTMKNTIPDEMRDISNCDWSGNKILVPDLSGGSYKLYYGNGDKEQNGLYDYVDGGFELDSSYNQVFLYGKEIDDFHILDKSKIYAVLTSAVQELDKKVKVLETKLAQEEVKTSYFEMKINQILYHLNL